MRNREAIEREMFRAREDLEVNLAELKHVMREKVDVRARARVSLEKGKLMAADAFQRSKQGARDRPALTASIIAGIVAAGVLFYVGRRREWW
jgi:hypothetical protein